ncbi:hypothetical protein HK405_002496, partial [Cladochytrium tenue]
MFTRSRSRPRAAADNAPGPSTSVHVAPLPPQASIAADAAFQSIIHDYFASLSRDLHQPLVDSAVPASAFVSDPSIRAWLGFTPGILTLEGVLAYLRSIFYSVETICARIDGFPESIQKDAKVTWVFTACCCKSTQMYKFPKQDSIAILKVTAEFANTAAGTVTGGTSQSNSPDAIALAKYHSSLVMMHLWAHQTTVIRIAQFLRDSGLRVWMDRSHMSGAVFAAMQAAVLDSKIIIPCLSRTYGQSSNCLREIRYAAEQRKDMIPIRLDSGPFGECEFITTGLLYIDFGINPHISNQNLEQLVGEIRHVQKNGGGTNSGNLITNFTTGIDSDPVMAILESKFKPVKVIDQIVSRDYSRQAGTRDWLVEEVENWMADDSGKRV